MDDIEWSKEPEILDLPTSIPGEGVTPECFDEKTRWRFIHRRFGFREHKAIPKDSFRMDKQKELMQARGEGGNEPVIVLQTKKGLLDLLEGWHRTMNYLVTGAPEDQLEMLKNSSDVVQGLDFSKWKPVKIMAYIGRGPEIRSML